MYQLIYAGKDVEQAVKERYPEAKIKDASDDIHTERFECEIDVEEDEFFVWAILEGYADACLSFQLMMRDYPEGSRQKVWDYAAESRAIDESEDYKYSRKKVSV
ncbi:unnamed protein product [marine sediment metagenome]|uniref:Uncharacterized protein n=1 Tax=marine sediment metagenome TaxID=412755 RepID=X1RJ21_9ZZZZ